MRPKLWRYSSCARTPPRHQGEESGVDWKASVGVWEGRYCRFSFCVQGRMICRVGAAFICKVVTPHIVIVILDFCAMQFFMIVIRLARF